MNHDISSIYLDLYTTRICEIYVGIIMCIIRTVYIDVYICTGYTVCTLQWCRPQTQALSQLRTHRWCTKYHASSLKSLCLQSFQLENTIACLENQRKHGGPNRTSHWSSTQTAKPITWDYPSHNVPTTCPFPKVSTSFPWTYYVVKYGQLGNYNDVIK